jgi:hypothetical protein
MTYYQPNPQQMIVFWKHFAVAAPIIAIIGMFMNRKLIWLGSYIILSAIICIFSTRSDFVRYSIHLFPLILICGAPILKNKYVAIIAIVFLSWQGIDSVKYFRYQCSQIAPVQELRREAGEWLNKNADKNEWVMSNDLGMIGYIAKDFKIIDVAGLCSRDVLNNYARGKSTDEIIKRKNPKHIVGTFEIVDGKPVFPYNNTQFSRHVDSNILPEYTVVWGKQFKENLAICVAEVNEKQKEY